VEGPSVDLPSPCSDLCLVLPVCVYQGYREEAQELDTNFVHGGPADKYRNASVADFVDEFQTLPGDANPLDPALADPAIARRGRLRFLQRGGRGMPLWGAGGAQLGK
jgi:hypothetical protein